MRAEKAGHQRDLFRLEGPVFGGDDLENAFGSVEGQIAPVLRKVVQTRQLPAEPQAMSILLHLPALNASRPPAEIKSLADTADTILRSLVVEEITPELHERVLSEWRAAGQDTSSIEDIEELKQRISEGGVRAVPDRNYLLTHVLGRASMLVDFLHNRSWTLLQANEGTGYFVCSDRPVSLLNNRNLPAGIQPRFDDHRFDVIMPLSKELCLIGHLRGKDGAGQTSRNTIGFINHITELGADDQIYSPTREYHVTAAADLPAVGESYKEDVLRAYK